MFVFQNFTSDLSSFLLCVYLITDVTFKGITADM